MKITSKLFYNRVIHYVESLSISNDLYYHREDGPAVEWNDGGKEWWSNNKIHRVDGPAIEYTSGEKEWYINGKLHRLDGPAVEYLLGNKEWYYQGQYIDCNSQEEFERLIKLKAFW